MKRWHCIGLRIGIFCLLVWGLFSLRWLPPRGADGWFMESLLVSHEWPCYYRSILTVWIHKLLYVMLHPLGFEANQAIAMSSALAGAIAIQTLWAIRSHALFLAINILSGSFLVFVGHIENYAWVNAFLLLTFLWGKYYIENQSPAWGVLVFFLLAWFSHMLAVFYIPAMVYLFWKKPPPNSFEITLPLIVYGITVSVLSLTGPMMGTDNGLERLVPWFKTWAKNHHFTFLSWKHLEMLGYFHHRAAFLWIPIELPLLFWFRKRIDTLYLKFLFVCVCCGLFWTTIWHPDWGDKDWDLFSQFGISLHVLLGLLITDYGRFKKTENIDCSQPG